MHEEVYDRRFMNIGTMFSILSHMEDEGGMRHSVTVDFAERGESDGIHVAMTDDNHYEVYMIMDGHKLNSKVLATEEEFCSEVLRLCGCNLSEAKK